MKCCSFILFCFAVLLIGEVTPLSKRCERCKGVACAPEAKCVKNKCQCPPHKPNGNPKFECYESETAVCELIGDPVVYGFSGQTIAVDHPCVYNLAVFSAAVTQEVTIKSGNRRCPVDREKNRVTFEISASNEVTERGTYFLANLIINIEVKLLGLKFELSITINKNGVSIGFGKFKPLLISLDKLKLCTSRTIEGCSLEVGLCYDADLNLITTSFPGVAETKISVRFANGADYEEQRPGFSVSTLTNNVRFDQRGLYPNTACGAKDNNVDIRSNCSSRGFRSLQACGWHNLLEYPAPNQPPECDAIIAVFKKLPLSDRLEASKVCLPLVSQYRNCIIGNKLNLLSFLKGCVADVGNRKFNKSNYHSRIRGSGKGCGNELDDFFNKLEAPQEEAPQEEAPQRPPVRGSKS